MRIEAVQGDITTQQVDAIVNAANSSLMGGGGVDGAIHATAGPELLEECRRVRQERYPQGLPVGEAVATGAGRLPARWVVHTVGPNRHAGETDPALLASCFRRSLQVASMVGAATVALPAVSAGIYGWSGSDVARIAVAAVREADDEGLAGGVELSRFVLFGPALHELFLAQLGQLVSAPVLEKLGSGARWGAPVLEKLGSGARWGAPVLEKLGSGAFQGLRLSSDGCWV